MVQWLAAIFSIIERPVFATAAAAINRQKNWDKPSMHVVVITGAWTVMPVLTGIKRRYWSVPDLRVSARSKILAPSRGGQALNEV